VSALLSLATIGAHYIASIEVVNPLASGFVITIIGAAAAVQALDESCGESLNESCAVSTNVALFCFTPPR
jgi:hypothetical protein